MTIRITNLVRTTKKAKTVITTTKIQRSMVLEEKRTLGRRRVNSRKRQNRGRRISKYIMDDLTIDLDSTITMTTKNLSLNIMSP